VAAAGLHPDNTDRGASPLERALIVCYIEFDGAVAQLGERSVRNAEVEGSIPFRSMHFCLFDDFQLLFDSQAAAKLMDV
jgi:hypothetical protein